LSERGDFSEFLLLSAIQEFTKLNSIELHLMSQKKLTIAIPTYNRASLLNKRLEFLAREIFGLEDDCEILISDNRSTDNTVEIIERWKPKFKHGCLIVNQNSENIGAIRNIALCINLASAKHVWVSSDDDNLFDGIIARIVANLESSPDLGLLFLNYSTFDINSGIREERGFDLEDKESADGKSLFEELFALEYGWGALILTTALVYRTDLAKQAISQWEDGLSNLMFQLYVTAFCALHGSMRTTKYTCFEYVHGRSFFIVKNYFIKLHYVDKPRIYLKLMEMGYSPQICKRNVLWIFTNPQELLLATKLLIKRPLLTLKCLITGFPPVIRVLVGVERIPSSGS
jgi:abequosyltransferase